MWRDDLGISRKVVDIDFASRCLKKWFNPKMKHCASKMLHFVIRRLCDEEVPLKITKKICLGNPTDEEVMAYYNASKMT